MKSSIIPVCLSLILGLIPAITIEPVITVSFAADRAAGREAVESAEYPRLVAFRVSEGLRRRAQYAPYALFDLIHSFHNLDFEYLKRYNSTAPIVAHWRLGIAPKPGVAPAGPAEEKYYLTKLGDQMWPGHWLFYNGTKLTRDLPAESTALTIHVDDTNVFQNPREAPAEFGPDDIQIYSLDTQGNPVWEQSEQVVLESIDHAAKTITVRRGQYRSSPLAFRAGRAVAAVHARTHLRNGPDPYAWRINFTRHSPVNPANGLTGAEFAGRLMGEELKKNHSINGAQFDVAEWAVKSLTITPYRDFDANNDLKSDHCYFAYPGLGVVNEHGLGQSNCLKAMRAVTGDEKILQADSQMRVYEYLNGSEWEKYPSNRLLASSQFEHLRFVSDRIRRSPKISYLLGKTFTDEYNNNPAKRWGDNWPRLGLASALMCDAYYGYNAFEKGIRRRKTRLGFGRFYLWDEFDGGKPGGKNYLGKPLEPPKTLAGSLKTGNALRSLKERGSVQIQAKPGYEAVARYNQEEDVLAVEIVKQPAVPTEKGIGVFIPKENIPFPAHTPFTLKTSVRALTHYGKIDPAYERVPALIKCTVNPEARAIPYFYADSEWQAVSLPLYAGAGFKGLTFYLGDDPGILELRGLKLFPGDDFAMYRLFKNGIALLNGTISPVSFDLSKIDPARQYRAIAGTITPEVNDGQAVRGPVIVPPTDGRILVLK